LSLHRGRLSRRRQPAGRPAGRDCGLSAGRGDRTTCGCSFSNPRPGRAQQRHLQSWRCVYVLNNPKGTDYTGEDWIGDSPAEIARLPGAAVHRKREMCVRETAATGTSFPMQAARGSTETETFATDRGGERHGGRTSPMISVSYHEKQLYSGGPRSRLACRDPVTEGTSFTRQHAAEIRPRELGGGYLKT
jgi:hypothetical protein